MKKLLKSLLPGIFLIGFNIGTGSVTTMAKAGATYGMSLLWTILISCAITYVLINIYGKYTVVTGETALEAFKKHIHPGVALFFIIALTVNVCGSVMGVMGVVADICFVWSKNYIQGGIKPIYFAGFFVVFVYLLFLQGKTDFFQKALTIIVSIMALCFIVNFVLFIPPAKQILEGLFPKMPEQTGDNNAFLVVASMAGTTVFSGLFIIRTTLVKEAGWSIKDMKTQKRDAFFSGFLMFIISASIMAAAAGTLFVKGIGLENVSQMINLLEPLAGKFATSIFAVGIIAAGVSSQFPNVLMLPWLHCDYNQTNRDMKQTKYRIIVLLISLLGLVVPLFHAKPILVMIASQAFGAIILPVTIACIFYLGNSKQIMGKYKNSIATNMILLLIFSFSIYLSIIGFQGLSELL